jgi:hypothetical protein
MPKIQWTNLPPALRDHLFKRLRERKITAEDLYQLKQWRESEPEAPDEQGQARFKQQMYDDRGHALLRAAG